MKRARRLGRAPPRPHSIRCTLTPSALSVAATCAPAASSRTASTTRAPHSASRRAVSTPMPDDPPVTTAVFPARSGLPHAATTSAAVEHAFRGMAVAGGWGVRVGLETRARSHTVRPSPRSLVSRLEHVGEPVVERGKVAVVVGGRPGEERLERRGHERCDRRVPDGRVLRLALGVDLQE